MNININTKPVILFLLPLPPPFAGPETIALGTIESLHAINCYDFILVNSTIRVLNQNKGKFDLSGIFAFISVFRKFISHLLESKVVFMYLCSSKIGFIRDSIYILCGILFGNKVIAQYHGGNFRSFYNHRSLIYRAFIRFTLSKLSNLIVLGESLAPMYKDIYPLNRIVFLRNGVNPSLFPVKKQSYSSSFTIFFLGHLTFPKGFYDLVIAYKSLYRKHGNKISFIFAGERVGYKTELASYLTTEWANFYLENIDNIVDTMRDFIDNADSFNAKYLGLINPKQRLQILHTSDLFVLPSYSEGLSMSCIEAMAVGLPIITTPVGAMSEIVLNGKGGIIVEVGKPEQLAAKIEMLLFNRKLTYEMASFNQKFARQKLDIKTISTELYQLLSSLL